MSFFIFIKPNENLRYLYSIRLQMEVRNMDVEKITELVDEAKSIAILLEHDLYMQKQDMSTINAVKVIHHLLKDAKESMT